jgi:hypothetical protein
LVSTAAEQECARDEGKDNKQFHITTLSIWRLGKILRELVARLNVRFGWRCALGILGIWWSGTRSKENEDHGDERQFHYERL